jgi:hypothetical protein
LQNSLQAATWENGQQRSPLPSITGAATASRTVFTAALVTGRWTAAAPGAVTATAATQRATMPPDIDLTIFPKKKKKKNTKKKKSSENLTKKKKK